MTISQYCFIVNSEKDKLGILGKFGIKTPVTNTQASMSYPTWKANSHMNNYTRD